MKWIDGLKEFNKTKIYINWVVVPLYLEKELIHIKQLWK